MAHLCLCAAEALEAWKKVENSIVSFTAVGISIDSEAATEASAACATAQALIVSLFPAGKNLLSIVLMQSLIFRHGINLQITVNHHCGQPPSHAHGEL